MKKNFHFMVERIMQAVSCSALSPETLNTFKPFFEAFMFQYLTNNRDIDTTDVEEFAKAFCSSVYKNSVYLKYIPGLVVIPYLRARLDIEYGMDRSDRIFEKHVKTYKNFSYSDVGDSLYDFAKKYADDIVLWGKYVA